MEACATARYWATRDASLGHDVKLLPAQHPRPSCCATRPMPWMHRRFWVAAATTTHQTSASKDRTATSLYVPDGLRRQLMKMRIALQNQQRCVASG